MDKLPHSTEAYQVYIFGSRAHRPFIFAIHTWIVIVSESGTQRFEVLFKKQKNTYGYVYKNKYPPTQGLPESPGSRELSESFLIGEITGGQGSEAQRVLKFIEDYVDDYLYKDRYWIYPGPNSNTFVQWVLDKFPEAHIKLPWNAFGKNYN